MADMSERKPDGGPLLYYRVGGKLVTVGVEQQTKNNTAPVLTPKEENDEIPLSQPTNSSQPACEVKTEDTAVTLLKTPVVWSPQTVKAAVSRLGPQPAQSSKTSPPEPVVKTQDQDPGSPPKASVSRSPVSVKAPVTRLSERQQTQPTQSSSYVVAEFLEDETYTSTVPADISRGVLRGDRRREIKVVQEGRYHRSRVLTGPWRKVGDFLLQGKFQRVPRAMMKVPGFKDYVVAEVLRMIDRECKVLTSSTFNSALRENNLKVLKDFSWDRVIREWKNAAPTFLKCLRRASKVYENQSLTLQDKRPMMAMGGSLLLRARASCICAPQYVNSMILKNGGTKRSCMAELNKLGICMYGRKSMLNLRSAGKKQAKTKQRPEETETRVPDASGDVGGSSQSATVSACRVGDGSPTESAGEPSPTSQEERDSDVPEITYILT